MYTFEDHTKLRKKCVQGICYPQHLPMKWNVLSFHSFDCPPYMYMGGEEVEQGTISLQANLLVEIRFKVRHATLPRDAATVKSTVQEEGLNILKQYVTLHRPHTIIADERANPACMSKENLGIPYL